MAVVKGKSSKGKAKSTTGAAKSRKSSSRYVGQIPKDARVSTARWAAWLAPEVAPESRHPKVKYIWVARSTLKPGKNNQHVTASTPAKAAQAAFASQGWKSKNVVIADEVDGHTAFVYEMEHNDETGKTRIVHVKTIPNEKGEHIIHDRTRRTTGRSTKSKKSATMEEEGEMETVDHHRSAKAEAIKAVVVAAKEGTGRGEKTAVAKILTQVLRQHLQHHALGLSAAKANAESKKIVAEAVKLAKAESLSKEASDAIKNSVSDHVSNLLTMAQ